MSSAINAYFEHAQLSMAAYANLTDGMSNDVIREVLKNSGFSDIQAANFVDTYFIVKVFNDPATNFSATLFQKRGSSEKILAIRGSESWQEVSQGLILVG